jgi:hypothetical protein
LGTQHTENISGRGSCRQRSRTPRLRLLPERRWSSPPGTQHTARMPRRCRQHRRSMSDHMSPCREPGWCNRAFIPSHVECASFPRYCRIRTLSTEVRLNLEVKGGSNQQWFERWVSARSSECGWASGRLTWRSAAVTRFMSVVPARCGCSQLPVTRVSRVESNRISPDGTGSTSRVTSKSTSPDTLP